MRDLHPEDVKVWVYRGCICGQTFQNPESAKAHADSWKQWLHDNGRWYWYDSRTGQETTKREHYIHSKLNIELAHDFGEYKKGQLVGTTQRISLIRSIIKAKIPSVRVVQGKGTAYGWCDIWAKDHTSFTEAENQALVDLGLHKGGNCEGIDSQDQNYHIAKWLGVPVSTEDFPKREYD